MTSLSERILAGDIRALARGLTQIENDTDLGHELLDRLYPYTGQAHTIGITGPPGAGKSTLVNELIRSYRHEGRRVAVIAVDPSSPLTGGATLGDRIRMQEWHADPDVYIRSMASRSFGGGLAENTFAAVHALDAAGFDPILIETVGSGQDEVAIASLAMTTLLVQVPGTGDSVQSIKAGSLEIGDILVVTKGDRPEAADLARDLRALRMIALGAGTSLDAYEQPVCKVSAMSRQGMDQLIAAIRKHHRWLIASGAMDDRRRAMIAAEISAHVQRAVLRKLADHRSSDLTTTLIDRVLQKEESPLHAARQIAALLTPRGEPPGTML